MSITEITVRSKRIVSRKIKNRYRDCPFVYALTNGIRRYEVSAGSTSKIIFVSFFP